MSQPNPMTSLFGAIDVSANPNSSSNTRVSSEELMVGLLRQMVATQERQTKLMEEMAAHLGAGHRQRQQELGNWKEQNPELAKGCKAAAELLAKVQTQYIRQITDEVNSSDDNLLESDYMLNEFVDRFGPRLAHLTGLLQVLSSLSPVEVAEKKAATE